MTDSRIRTKQGITSQRPVFGFDMVRRDVEHATANEGMTSYFQSSVNLYNSAGELKSLSDVGNTATHEVLHTLRLGYSFEVAQTADTKLIRVVPDSFISTSTTDKNIVKNIMKTIGLTLLAHQLLIGNCCLLFVTIFMYSCGSIKCQRDCDLAQYDTLTQQHVYLFVEEMPYYKDGDMAFLTDFNKYFQYDFSLHPEEKNQTKLQVQFIIDDKGHLMGTRIYNKTINKLTDFEKAGLEALNLMQNWQAGVHKGKAVNVILTKTIYIEANDLR